MIFLEQCYIGTLSVFEYQKNKLDNKQTTLEKVLVLDNIPCYLSSFLSTRSQVRDSSNSKFINMSQQVKKIFLSPKYKINAGSYITILQNGKFYEFSYAGESYLYSTHQEIYLEDTIIV